MNKNSLHKENKGNSITILRAPHWLSQLFTRFGILLLLVALISLSLFISPDRAASQLRTQVSFGETAVTNIFPTSVQTSDWTGVNDALVHELGASAIYHNFTPQNSAALEMVSTAPAQQSVDTTPREDGADVGETTEDAPTESGSDASDEESGNSTPAEIPVAPSEEEIGFFVPVRGAFPLAQLSMMSTTAPMMESGIESVVEEMIELDTTPPAVTVPQEEIIEGDVDAIDGATVASSTDVSEESTQQTYISPYSDYYDISLGNFTTAQLESGQFVTDVRLHMSFAAKLKSPVTSGPAPYVEILLSHDNQLYSVGAILVDDEVSNALNGGYFMFALPDDFAIENFSDAEVTVRFFGELSQIRGMYLDALWIEMETVTYSVEELKRRALAEQAAHLEPPQFSELVSEKLEFTRTEAPLFHLRYNEQRTVFEQGFFRMLGRERVSVDKLLFVHKSIGELPIEPEVMVTRDGLVSINVPEEELPKFQPGLYEVVIVYNENGTEVVDRFDFQWGVLGMNPDKSEYEIGETATIGLGALSPNGNTLCDASLDLYVTDPSGFISKTLVTPSGACNGNNVITVPDYTATVPVVLPGTYELYLERIDEDGTVISFLSDSFLAVEEQPLAIRRTGPTRIYPKVPYTMQLAVEADAGFFGTLVERVPRDFEVTNTSATITTEGDWNILTWNIDVDGPGVSVVSYTFDAPDISPFVYFVGGASLRSGVVIPVESLYQESSSTTDSLNESELSESEISNDEPLVESTPDVSALPPQDEVESEPSPEPAPVEEENITESTDVSLHNVTPTRLLSLETNQTIHFQEHRQWHIASDAVGSLLMLWDGVSIPSGWTCVSCSPGDPFYQTFIMGSSTAGATGGATTHTHTVSASVAATANLVAVGGGGAANYASAAHTHTFAAPVIGAASNIPAYRNLVVIQRNSAGEPSIVPTGVIGIFDAAVPAGWTQYNTQNGRYVRGDNEASIGGIGGSNTHQHSITGTLGASAGTANANTAGAVAIANTAHTHTVNTLISVDSNEPPFIEVILGKLNSDSYLPDGIIGMWTEDEPVGWNIVSSSTQAFSNRIFKPAATYGATGGSTDHTPANQSVVSGGPSATTNRGGAGNSRPTGAHTHTINLTGFSNATHLPPYRTAVFAKRAGGAPPQPSRLALFDYEKTGTSTPTFIFVASDTSGTDSIEYEFQWATSSDFVSPLGYRSSANESGCSPNCFRNTVNPGDTSPFNEEENISFTIQSPLTNGTTYYWRVRAKKSLMVVYGEWSDPRSFTYVADTDPSQWMQTTDTQFEGGTFNNTETFGTDSVRIIQDIPIGAMVAYGEGTVQTPRYRLWDGSAWSAEASALSVGGTIQWVKAAGGTKRDEYIVVTQDASSDVNVQVYNAALGTWGNLLEVTATVSDTTRRGFDVAYESVSGTGMVVYCDGDSNPSYRTWNGTTWSAAGTITTSSGNNCNYITLASDPTSNELIVVIRETGSQYEAQVWNGSTWANAITLGSIVEPNHEGMAIEYETSGNQAVLAVSNGAATTMLWTAWNGIEWSTPTTQALGDHLEWGVMKRDPGTDNLALCYIDNDDDIGFIRWNGETWAAFQEFETTGNSRLGRAVSCEFETLPGRVGNIMIPYSDTTNARWRVWNGSTLSGEVSISTIQDSWEVGTVRTGDGLILAYFNDDVNNRYDFSFWNGSAWSAIQTLETSRSVTATPFRQPIHMAAQVFQPSQGSYTSPLIPFSLVANQPTWGEVLWDTTEPSGTDVLIQVLYATSSVCNVPIPNGTLPGNAAGFQVTDSPLDISFLSTTTYNTLCLKASLSSTNENQPTLDDWTMSWERQPFLVQSQYRWYTNRNNQTPDDVWPVGGVDLSQNESISQQFAPGSGQVLRLRMAVRAENAALTTGSQAFKLQYAANTSECSAATQWFDVGAIGSSTALWRGYNNLLVADGVTLSTLLLGSDVAASYEEENNSVAIPNTVAIGNEAEWDWVLEHNGAAPNTNYCFRMSTGAGMPIQSYEEYPQLITNSNPAAPTLEKLFDNEQTASTTPWFEFVTEDIEGDDVVYQIQVDNNYDFGSTVLDRNSTTNTTEFENVINVADKDPFTVGQRVRFIPTTALSNNTTYYWRVRARDNGGSGVWSEWSTIQSFTVNTGTTITTWFQTEEEQFATNEHSDTEPTVSDDVILTTGFNNGTTTSTAIDFDDKTTGNAWGSLSWTDNETLGTIRYRVEYFTGTEWAYVPDSFLPSNSAGFTTSPVSLLGLDPLVHNEIRIEAVLVRGTGTPRLLDWRVQWGLAVEQPTQLSLFDNEKTGTTTPTFTFQSTDPDFDDLQYELSWSTDVSFASGSTTVLSGVSAGFLNTVNGGDTSPFNSGDVISYKVQPANVLSNGQTYWWRVRARDPNGGNNWSVWSPTRSFTVDTTVTVSTWFQTTNEQFSTDFLSDVETSGGGVTVSSIIREAFTSYAEGTIQTPRYRIWNGTQWSEEASALSVGSAIRFVEVEAAPTRDEYIIATQEGTGRVRAQIFNGATDTFSNLETIITAVPSITRRGYDIAYESISGDAMVVACDGTEAMYKKWNGTSWSAATSITLNVTAACNWVKLASDPTSNEIILVVRDGISGATDYQALVWNGSTWGNSMNMGSMAEANNEGIAIEYETSGDRAVVAVSNGAAASFVWNTWNGTAWTGATTQALQDDFEGARLSRDPNSDNMVMCTIDEDTQIAMLRWNGTTNTWNAFQTIETLGNAKAGRPMDCVFENTSGRTGYIMVPYSDTTNARYRVWDGATLSAEATLGTTQDSWEVRAIRTGDDKILTVFYDDVNTQYDFSYWDGSAWSSTQVLDDTSIVTTNPATVPIDITARIYPTFTSGSVVSTPINFSDGLGLKWQTFTFNDTRPGSSLITYRVEYFDGSSWATVPNAGLAGNEAGFTSSPIDLSSMSRVTYNTIRLRANLQCVGGNCPTLNDWTVTWSEGIVVSGVAQEYNRTASTTSGTVGIAVNGVLQAGKTGTIVNGAWSIPNVTAFAGDIVTVFVSGAADADESVAVTRYDGDGDITGLSLAKRHLTLGSNDATTTPLTNSDIGLYDFSATEDVFADVSGVALTVCATTGCNDVQLRVLAGTTYAPGGAVTTHGFLNFGTFTPATHTIRVSGSWYNAGVTSMGTSNVIFTATTTTVVPLPWYNSSWSHRAAVTIQSSQVDSNLTNFPVFVDLSTLDATFFANVAADGRDIRITTADGITELPREIVSIDTSLSTGEIHFRADALSSSADTTFYIYYGNPSASNYANNATYGRNAVWSNGYQLVYHFDESPTAGSPQYIDSTGNSTAVAVNMEGGDRITGVVGRAADVDGADESIQSDFSQNLLTSTWSAFINADGVQGGCDGLFFSRGTNVSGINLGACGDVNRIGYHWNDAATSYNWAGGPLYPTGQWFMATMVIEATQATIYAHTSGGVTSGVNTTTHATSNINNLDFGWDSFGVARSFNGAFDEARLSNVARSEDWLDAEYRNLSDASSFYTPGASITYLSSLGGSNPYILEDADGTLDFYNVTFGETSGSATWQINNALDADNALTVAYGTLQRGTQPIVVGGNLHTQANGFWAGIGTTTFDGNVTATWRDQNASLQNVGHVVVDGTSKAVTLASAVAAQSITIGGNDTLDASTSNYNLTVYGSWVNQNNFIPRLGTVFFAATSSGHTITTNGSSFYNLTFNGSSGAWSFTAPTLQVNNNLRFAAGATTLPTGTTTVAGGFDATGGTFLNNNGTIAFSANNSRNITFAGTAFTNVAHNLVFSGVGGNWTITDTHATATNAVRVSQGTVTFPSGVFAIGGSLADVGGVFNGGGGTVRMYSSATATITSGGSSFSNLVFDGDGPFSFTDSLAAATGNVTMRAGTTTLPTGTFSIGGSYDNDAVVVAGTGTVLFNSTDGGETIALGNSPLHNITFNAAGGGWTVVESATSTGNVSLANAATWTLASGQHLSVTGSFTNALANASTTWTGSVLSLEGGTYTINSKTNGGDAYHALRVASGAQIKMWNSTSTTYDVSGSGYLYSQDHNGSDGELHIWGSYVRTSGTEYWSYDTDFDGTPLTGGNERQVTVRFAATDVVETFTSGGSFTPPAGVEEVDVLVVAGGGGGGSATGFTNAGAGGGGAGGVIYRNNFAVTPLSPLAVTIGAGGNGGTTGNVSGTTGQNSVFGSLTALGGGGGIGGNGNGLAGGSGGGARGGNGGAGNQPGSASGGFGNRGGNGAGGAPAGAAAGGGGGAGGQGQDRAGTAGEAGGNGGAGLAYDISGVSTYYGGGGGGGGAQTNAFGTGGLGGGGNGGNNGTAPSAGTANTGGGGGGGNNAQTGASGGSGIVVVRYSMSATAQFTGATLEIEGAPTASTTITNQGTGNYSVSVRGGTVRANYYGFENLGGDGFSLLNAATVTTLDHGSYTVGGPSDTALTISSTTIDANPAKQLFNVRFATTTAIAAFNVTQNDGAPSSYWWFRNGTGNLYGEAYDNDTGNPGSIRFDDSSIILTISGTVYSDAGVTPLAGGTCNGSANVVRLLVNGSAATTTSCSASNGSYSFPGVAVTGDPVITVYLDNASGGQRATTITRTPTVNISNLDLYANRVIVRNEDVAPLTIANMAVFDSNNDADIRFIATTTGSVPTLTTLSGTELFVFASSTFTPGGVVTLAANAQANGYDGTLAIGSNAVFNAFATSTLTIGGRLALASGSQFNAASTTVVMSATTTGKSITGPAEITFNELVFVGSGGAWNLDAPIRVLADMDVVAGTVTGTNNITIPFGSLTGNGTLSLGGGTTTIERTNTLGGTTAWTFHNLRLGNGVNVGTTTPLFTATTTIGGRLTISPAHYLDAGATTWDLAGTGTVLVEGGTFLEDTSTIRYSGNGATVASTQYYNLDINAGAGIPTYTASGLGIGVTNLLTIGGTAPSTFNITTNDVVVDVNGSVLIRSNGTLIASDTATFTIAGNYTNQGTFTGSGGTVTFDGAATTNIAAGASPFSRVAITNPAGTFIVTEHATATEAWRLQSASSFSVASGQVLAVGAGFYNNLASGATTWTGSTLRFFGGADYQINAATSSDNYATIAVADTAQIRMWNSDASLYAVAPTASLYSQDHAAVDGDLYIWGAYRKTSGNDYWSYATDFDGTALTGNERAVEVFLADNSSVTYTGGSLSVIGASTASTSIQNQGTGTYSLLVGGTATLSMQYYQVRDSSSAGLVLTGTPTITTLSHGDFEVSQNAGSALTVGGTVITANPAKNFTGNRFALDGVGSGFNVTATGTTVSSWRFTNYTGDIAGEAFDVDPGGDPGYVVWDDSAANITISGRVYSDEGVTVPAICNGSTQSVRLVVAGITATTTSCATGTGAYSFTNVAYSPNDSIIAYLTSASGLVGATVTADPVSNITNLDIYANRLIVRHENTDPITIDDLAVYDSSDDANIPFTALSGSPDSLSLPADRKIIVWTGKTFAPGGDVTIAAGGSQAYGGTLALFDNAVWTGQGTEALSIGGSFTLASNAVFTASNGTTTFTTTGTGRTIDVNEASFRNVAFTGSGSWTITDSTFTLAGYLRKSSGTLTLPTGTTTVAGSFLQTGGTFDANNGHLRFVGTTTRSVAFGGSSVHRLTFVSGTSAMTDVNATATASVIHEAGTLTLPSGIFAIGGDFINRASVAHNTSELVFTNPTSALLSASSSDLFAVSFTGGGSYTMTDRNVTLLDTLRISSGDVALATGTLTVGGSFNAAGGTFSTATNTILFNSTDTGEIINPGSSSFYNVVIGAPTGGYSIIEHATTTNNFSITGAANFTLGSGKTLSVGGVFQNLVGGANTTWTGSTLLLNGANAYTVNTKSSGGDQYGTVVIGDASAIRMWNSSAATTTVAVSSSLYSQDHAAVDGALSIYGNFVIGTTTEYWNYATDFDGTGLVGGARRPVTVSMAANATTTMSGGALQIIGASGNETVITHQGAGTYTMNIGGGTFNALYYRFRNLGVQGLSFSGQPSIQSLSYGDFELAVNGGSLITLASTSLNANASLLSVGNRFATTTAISGFNVSLLGETLNAWTFSGHTGNLSGEAYDNDGVTECGSIRFDDSSCLLTQQIHYRWRNDDGGLQVPAAEWWNTNWGARTRVRVVNNDSTSYSDMVAKVLVPYDGDMRSDFNDLRFTLGDGVTPVAHWVGSTTNSVLAEVWVKIPTLPSDGTATVFMYYDNPTATSSSSVVNTFIAGDDFESGSLAAYSGQTSLFTTDAAFAFDGSLGLSNSGFTLSRSNTGGIYRTNQTVSQGQTFRFMQYVDTSAGSGDEVCTKFAVQNPGSSNNNYAVCLEQFGTDRVSLVRNAVDNDTSGVILASSTITYATGWYVVEVDWAVGGAMSVSVYDASGVLAATVTASDSTYSSGGYGFSYWFHSGGWDSVTARPLVTTEPTVLLGVKQQEGGATWKAAQDTQASYDIGDIARLRLVVENTGLSISNQQFRLEFARMGTAPSCEAVNPNNYVPVPPQSSCSGSAMCMVDTLTITNGESTVDLLNVNKSLFTPGEARENPTNMTSAIDVDQGYYTELEYAITPTVNVDDENFCFRVTNNGSQYDSYLKIARLSMRFDPTIANVTLNGGMPIALVPGTTTAVYATSTVTDLNGSGDLANATTTFYRGGVGAACTPDNNNCYIASGDQCEFISCNATTCTLSCRVDMFFHAEPTDSGDYEGQQWFAFSEVNDVAGGYDFDTSMGQELSTLRAITVEGSINYGALAVNADTGSYNATTSIINLGNVPANIEVIGTDLTDGIESFIPAEQQKFSTSTFTYSACGVTCELLSSTSPVAMAIELGKPTAVTPPVTDTLYWGIAVPIGVNSVPHQGINVFTPVSVN